jgi:ribonuclease BN (tRNA processing enzyme)
MSTLIITLGHGGGVPLGIGRGNTNFAVVPHYDSFELGEGYPDEGTEDFAWAVLSHFPWYLIDCGPETMLWLCSTAGQDCPVLRNLQSIFITHTHDDHCGGLNSLAWRMYFVQQRRSITLRATHAVRGLLLPRLRELEYMNSRVITDYHSRNELQFAEVPKGIGLLPFYGMEALYEGRFGSARHHFQWFPVDHNIVGFPSFGLHLGIDSGDKDNPHRIVFSGDTAYPLPARMFANNDLIYHDVQTYNDGDGYHVHCPLGTLQGEVKLDYWDKIRLVHGGRKSSKPISGSLRWSGRFDIEVLD